MSARPELHGSLEGRRPWTAGGVREGIGAMTSQHNNEPALKDQRRTEIRGVIAMSIPVVITTSSRALMDVADYVMMTTGSIGYPTPGSLGCWAGVERSLATITLELPSHHSPKCCWEDNRSALLEACSM